MNLKIYGTISKQKKYTIRKANQKMNLPEGGQTQTLKEIFKVRTLGKRYEICGPYSATHAESQPPNNEEIRGK